MNFSDENCRIAAPEFKPPRMETMQKTAELFGVSYYFVRKLALSGKINAVRVAGRILVNCDKFAEFLNTATLSSLDEPSTLSTGIRDLTLSARHTTRKVV